MYEFIAQHPDVFVPAKKEIHFFGTDLYSPHYNRDPDSYLGLFNEASTEKRVGEASVWYLYSKLAANEIKEFSPSAGIIIMLRNPVDMIYSLHSHRLYINSEDIEDFDEALAAESDRKLGRRLPANPFPVAGLFYREVGKYSEQIERYFDAFGRDQVKIILYDDFKTDPLASCQEVFSFLGVQSPFPVEIGVVNASKKVRNRTLASLLDPPPAIVRKLGRALTTAERRHKLFRTFQELNTEHGPRPLMSPTLRSELQQEFAPDVERLSKLLDRDLMHWCRPIEEHV